MVRASSGFMEEVETEFIQGGDGSVALYLPQVLEMYWGRASLMRFLASLGVSETDSLFPHKCSC